MSDTSVKLSGTYDSIEAYNIMVEMQNMSADYEEIRTEAAAAASAATAAVTTAQTAANSASTYAGNAQTYAGNANTSAGEAAGYASDASTAATNAASSETNAHNSEVAAAASASSAAASEAVVAGALPLTGGTMTGSIQYINNGKAFAIGNTVTGNVDLGWSWDNREGAGLGLRSTDYSSPGEFTLFARNSANSCSFTGKPDGSLTWDGNAVATVTASSINSSAGYIRFSNGLQVCWGEATVASAGATVTLPAAFIDASYRITEGRWWLMNWNESYYFADRTTTSFKRYAIGTLGSNSRVSMYIAIGKWK